MKDFANQSKTIDKKEKKEETGKAIAKLFVLHAKANTFSHYFFKFKF